MNFSMSYTSSSSLESGSCSGSLSDSSDSFSWGGVDCRRSTYEPVWEHEHDMKQWREKELYKEPGWVNDHIDRSGLVVGRNYKPDLLDSLIMEEEKSKLMRRNGNTDPRQKSFLQENLLKLLQLQQLSSPEGRPITGKTTDFINQYQDKVQQDDQVKFPMVFPGQFPPINYKIPPPHHPPAVPANFEHSQFALTPKPISSRYTSLPSSSPTTYIRRDCSTFFQSTSASGSPTNFQLRVEELKWQFKALENERRKIEATLATRNEGKKLSINSLVQIPRLSPCPSRLDKLLVDIMIELARVVTIVDTSYAIKNQSVSLDLSRWKDSVLNMMKRERLGPVEKQSDWEVEAMVVKLTGDVRQARTFLWTASV